MRRICSTPSLLKVPVIVGSIYDAPEANQRYDAVFSLPAELQKRGVKIALPRRSVAVPPRTVEICRAAGYAVAYGLPYDEAMKAITLNPAEMFGVADQLGSLECGQGCERSDRERRPAGRPHLGATSIYRRSRDSDDEPSDAAARPVSATYPKGKVTGNRYLLLKIELSSREPVTFSFFSRFLHSTRCFFNPSRKASS